MSERVSDRAALIRVQGRGKEGNEGAHRHGSEARGELREDEGKSSSTMVG